MSRTMNKMIPCLNDILLNSSNQDASSYLRLKQLWLVSLILNIKKYRFDGCWQFFFQILQLLGYLNKQWCNKKLLFKNKCFNYIALNRNIHIQNLTNKSLNLQLKIICHQYDELSFQM
ncbi:unnamed protein product [Paramecium sonneborni]|uniref:Uncharacterized protein n=1 Tax=Paramecium sonneborni TaxID=65129 RepID=A0A8S1R9X3_9CILI|nr:unnamed protein product [Paramecium sonneborni]